MRAQAGDHGVDLLGAGLHPAERFGHVRHRAGHRYDVIAETMRGLMRQTPHCGVHVHVGMPDGETAIRACNGMRAWMDRQRAAAARGGLPAVLEFLVEDTMDRPRRTRFRPSCSSRLPAVAAVSAPVERERPDHRRTAGVEG